MAKLQPEEIPAPVYCSLCEQCYLTVVASVWCPECEEALCIDCKKPHGLSRVSKNHKTITVEDYQSLPSFILQTAQFCTDHGERYDLYCKSDNAPCCRKCVSSLHKGCMDIDPLEDVVSNSKSTTIIEELDQTINDILEYLSKISDEQTNLKSKSEQGRAHLDARVKQMRKEINEHLDKIEENLLAEISTTIGKQVQQIEGFLTELADKKKSVRDIRHNIHRLKDHASDLQIFLGTRELETAIIEAENYITSLKDDERLNETIVSLKSTNDYEYLRSNLSCLAELTITCYQTSVKYKSWKEKQAQSLILQTKTKFDALSLFLEKIMKVPDTLETSSYGIRGCSFLPDRRYAFADYTSDRLVILNNEGTFLSQVDLKPTSAFDVTCIDEKTLACTSLDHKSVHIIDIERQKVIITKEKSVKCGGVDFCNGKLYYALQNVGIKAYTLASEEEVTISSKTTKIARVAAFRNKLFFTLHTSNPTVYCYSTNGKQIWEFKDAGILVRPGSLTVDRYSNVYVIGEKSCNVVAISADGKNHKQILSKADGLHNPTAIDCDKENNRLLLCNRDGTAFLYEIK